MTTFRDEAEKIISQMWVDWSEALSDDAAPNYEEKALDALTALHNREVERIHAVQLHDMKVMERAAYIGAANAYGTQRLRELAEEKRRRANGEYDMSDWTPISQEAVKAIIEAENRRANGEGEE